MYKSWLGKILLATWCLLTAMPAYAEQNTKQSTVQSLAQDFAAQKNLTLTEAMQLATQNQPLLQSLNDAAAAALEVAVAEGQLPDPKLKLGVLNLPINRGDALNFNRDDMTMTSIGVMQEITPSQKREAASSIMQAEARQFHTEQTATSRSIQRDVALAWLDAYEAQRKTLLYQQITDEMNAERKIAIFRISSGAAQANDVLRLDRELSMTKDKLLTAQRDERRARSGLARWIGEASLRPFPADLPDLPTTLNGAQGLAELEEHPLLENARYGEHVAIAEVERAKTERLQNWSWELMYGKRRSDLSDMVTLQVAIDLPWDRANRQDRRTAEKILLVEKARKLTEDRHRELAAELESAKADWDLAQAREDEHQQRLIPTVQARLELTQAGYASGRLALVEVWEARRSLIDVEIEHWTILADRARAAVKLGYLLNSHQFKGSQP
ncbi:MAG: TolC family protein [Methylotenera sp.]|nr:TolC family protein [Methylotenera sp.]